MAEIAHPKILPLQTFNSLHMPVVDTFDTNISFSGVRLDCVRMTCLRYAVLRRMRGLRQLAGR